MSNFLFNEDINYLIPKDDPVYSFFKDDEEESTEPPFSFNSESPMYKSNSYPYSNPKMEDISYKIGINSCYVPQNLSKFVYINS